jgi:hypothetical protein
VKAILDAITARDSRLKMFASSSEYGTFIEAFAYDADADGGTFERVWNDATYAYDHVKSDADDIFPALESDSFVDPVTSNYVYSGTSWMLLAGAGAVFEDIAFAETPNGADLTNSENGEWICWRICPYVSEYDADWNPTVVSNSAIYTINGSTLEATATKQFDHQFASYGGNLLACNGNTVYFIDDAVYSMTNNGEPTKLIEGTDFYGISVNAKSDEIWVTQTPYGASHSVSQYSANGTLVKTYKVSNQPNAVVFD